MPRTVRDARLATPTARLKLPAQHEPHWKAIDGGQHIGYRRGTRKASWIARYRTPEGRYLKTVLGIPDDIQDSNGRTILSFSEAQQKARDWFLDQTNGDSDAGPYTVAGAVRDYLTQCAAERKKNVVNIGYCADAFILPQLGDVEVADLRTKQIRGWHHELATLPPRVRTRRGAPQQFKLVPDEEDPEYIRGRQATANRALAILKACLNRAWRDGQVASDQEWRRVGRFKNVEAPRIIYLTEAECARLVNGAQPDFRKLVQAALLTGARYGELTALRCRDFNPDMGSIYIRTSKNGRPRDVPLTDEGIDLFSQLTAGRNPDARVFLRADGKPWGVGHQNRPFVAAAKVAQIKGVTFHGLRHAYAGLLAKQGVSMRVIADVLGHVSTDITEKHYAHLAPSHVADVVRRNLPSLGIVEPGNVTALKARQEG